MNDKTHKWRMLLASTGAAVAISGAQAQERALAPVEPTVMPHTDSAGTYGLRVRLRYFDTVTGNVELRRHQYSPDDNLKTQHPRTSIAWSVRWRF